MAPEKVMQDSWRKFQAAVMPNGAPEATESMRIAFYSGAMHAVNALCNSTTGENPRQWDLAAFQRLVEELRTFAVELGDIFEREKLRNLTRY